MMTPMVARLAFSLLVIGGTVAACSAATEPHGLTSPVATASVGARPAASRPPLPAAFPVLDGAIEAPPPRDDLRVLARWTTDRVGSVAFDFYLVALPVAGYPVLGAYPGDTVAIIRFTGREGQPWQVVVTELDAQRAQIEVRLDRP